MGADISFCGPQGEELFSFRDAYDCTNLAWVKHLSYYQCGQTVQERIAFFAALAAITDEEIARYVADMLRHDEDSNIPADVWVKMFTDKRERVRAHLADIKRAASITWDV